MKGLDHLLSAVSRSFYLSMRFLPREMRPGVAVGYLLAIRWRMPWTWIAGSAWRF